MKRLQGTLNLEIYYLGSWCALLILTTLILCLARVLSPVLAVFSLMVSALVLVPERFSRGRKIKVHWWVLLLYLCILWVFAAFVFLREHRIVELLGTLLLSFLPLFLSRKQKMFGSWMAFLVVSALALLGVIVGNTVTEYFLFLLFLLFLVFNLNAINLLILAGPTLARLTMLPKGHFRQFVPSLFWGAFSAATIFLFFPRSPALHNPFGIREKGVNTGYTGAVALKSQSEINASSTMAMMVESPEVDWLAKEGPNLYFRGNVLDHFSGEAWIQSKPGEYEYNERTDLRFITQYKLHAKPLKIYREPHGTRAVIYPNVLMSIRAPLYLLSGLHYDLNGNLMRGHSEVIHYAYEVVVAEPTLPKEWSQLPISKIREQLKNPNVAHPLPSMPTGVELQRFLQIPYSMTERNFFSQWVEEVGREKEVETLGSLNQQLRFHFNDKFSPALAYHFSSSNAFESFLSKDRKGHCEYFATATALFLRAHGIPTRMVLGYHGGTYNAVSKALEVRDLNAHAWVEAFVPELGWITVDSTPLAPSRSMSAVEAYFTLYAGAAKLWANHYIVDYNDRTQRKLVRSIATGGGMGMKGWGNFSFNPNRNWAYLGLAFLIVFYQIRRKRILEERAKGLPDYYLRFLKLLKQKGLEKYPEETYTSFHRRVLELAVGPGLDSQLIKLIDGCLERDLYSRRRGSTKDVDQILQLLLN